VYPRPGPSEWRTFGMADRYQKEQTQILCHRSVFASITCECCCVFQTEPQVSFDCYKCSVLNFICLFWH